MLPLTAKRNLSMGYTPLSGLQRDLPQGLWAYMCCFWHGAPIKLFNMLPIKLL